MFDGPFEDGAWPCSATNLKRQGGAGTFHVESEVGVAVQVVERGVDDYVDFDALFLHNFSTTTASWRAPPLYPNGGQPAFKNGPAAFSSSSGATSWYDHDFDGFAGGSGGAQGTRRALRIDGLGGPSLAPESLVTASGVQTRRPFAFDGLEHDLLGAYESYRDELAALGFMDANFNFSEHQETLRRNRTTITPPKVSTTKFS